jgi:aminoglycoside 6'-N-acetyltransferase
VAVCLRPLAPGDEADLVRIHRLAAVRRWWGDPEDEFPWEDPASTRLTVEVDGRVAGLIQWWEESDPRYRHAAVDVFLDPQWHGRGIGTEVLQRTLRILTHERGHHRVTIDPAATNAVAIRAYTKAGFKPVGVMHHYERDVDGSAWHDALLMEFVVADDPDEGTAAVRDAQ